MPAFVFQQRTMRKKKGRNFPFVAIKLAECLQGAFLCQQVRSDGGIIIVQDWRVTTKWKIASDHKPELQTRKQKKNNY